MDLQKIIPTWDNKNRDYSHCFFARNPSFFEQMMFCCSKQPYLRPCDAASWWCGSRIYIPTWHLHPLHYLIYLTTYDPPSPPLSHLPVPLTLPHFSFFPHPPQSSPLFFSLSPLSDIPSTTTKYVPPFLLIFFTSGGDTGRRPWNSTFIVVVVVEEKKGVIQTLMSFVVILFSDLKTVFMTLLFKYIFLDSLPDLKT